MAAQKAEPGARYQSYRVYHVILGGAIKQNLVGRNMSFQNQILTSPKCLCCAITPP
jgi:hypothetical protein